MYFYILLNTNPEVEFEKKFVTFNLDIFNILYYLLHSVSFWIISHKSRKFLQTNLKYFSFSAVSMFRVLIEFKFFHCMLSYYRDLCTSSAIIFTFLGIGYIQQRQDRSLVRLPCTNIIISFCNQNDFFPKYDFLCFIINHNGWYIFFGNVARTVITFSLVEDVSPSFS